MKNKYNILRFVAGLHIFFGWALFAIGLILGILSLIQSVNDFSKIEVIIITVSTVIGGLILVATGQLIYLLIDIEHNTRKQTMYIQNLANTSIIEPEITDSRESKASSPSQKISIDTRNSLIELNKLIDKEKRKLISGQNENITNLLKNLITDKETFHLLNLEYKKQFNKDIIEHLISISSSYATIYYYIEPLAELEICEKQFPHKII